MYTHLEINTLLEINIAIVYMYTHLEVNIVYMYTHLEINILYIGLADLSIRVRSVVARASWPLVGARFSAMVSTG